MTVTILAALAVPLLFGLGMLLGGGHGLIESFSADLLMRYAALERALTAKGWPATSSWWLETLTAFLHSGKRVLVLRVGRRGGKSSTLCRFAAAFALGYDVSAIPPGDVGVIAFISVSKDEAAQRLRTIKKELDDLRVRYRPIDGGIELVGRPIIFKVFPASVAGVSGFTSILVVCDEVAKWRDADTGANPAKEVIASVRPTMATQPNAKLVISSSPFGSSDHHFELFERGNTDAQHVAYAPTWTANPTVSEAQTHTLEPDDRVWRREYLAEPQSAASGAFDADDVAACFAPVPAGYEPIARVGVCDPSSLANDSWTWAVVTWFRSTEAVGPWKTRRTYVGNGHWSIEYERDDAGNLVPNPDHGKRRPTIVSLGNVGGVDRGRMRTMSGDAVVDLMARAFTAAGVRTAIGDQREALFVKAALDQRGIGYVSHAWTSGNKADAVALVRRWMRERALHLPEHDQLRRQLMNYEERIMPSGTIKYAARGAAHDDYAALVVMTAMVEGENLASAGVFRQPTRRANLHLLA